MADRLEGGTDFEEAPAKRSPAEGQAATDREGLVVAGRYRLDRLIGSGRSGPVYEAYDGSLQQRVALKLFHPTPGAKRFLEDARAASRLRHPNVVVIHDAGQDALGLYMVSELVCGEPLARLLGPEPLSALRVISLARQLSRAFAAAHAMGLLHGDLAPGNVIVTPGWVAKVTGLGIPHSNGSAGATIRPPEQIEGRSPRPASDVFALGALIHEALAGAPPFTGSTEGQVALRILSGRPDPMPIELRRGASELCRIVRAMLRRDPEDRPSAQKLGEDFAALERGEAPKKPARSRGSLLPLALVLAAIVPMVLARLLAVLPPPAPVPSTPAPPEAAPRERRPVPLTRHDPEDPGLGEVRRILRGVAGIDARFRIGKHGGLEVEAARLDASNAAALVCLWDSLAGVSLAREASLFSGGTGARERISLELTACPSSALFAVMARALAWNVVIDEEALDGRRIDVALRAVPWDVALKGILEKQGLSVLGCGGIWVLTSESRVHEIARAERPVAWIGRPPARALQQMKLALEPARSEHGAIVVSERLGVVLIADRVDAFKQYAPLWAAVRGKDPTAQPFPLRRYRGPSTSLDVERADPHDVFAFARDLTGPLFVLPRGLGGRLTVHVADTPRDNLVEVLALCLGLEAREDGSVVRLSARESTQETLALKLAHEDPATFLPLSACLTASGKLSIDPGTSALVIRDVPERARWLRELALKIDQMGP